MANKKYVEGLLNRVGKRVFINYFYEFKKLNASLVPNETIVNRLDEAFTLKSKRSRTSKAKRIFREGLELESLKSIVNSNDARMIKLKNRAKEILNKELTS